MLNKDINIPSLKEVEEHDAILILGEDIGQTGPILELAVRQAVKNTSKPG